MTHYEKRLEDDLLAIRGHIQDVSESIAIAIERAVQAALEGDRSIANQVILGDKAINRSIRRIDQLCYGFIARHLPSAGHLRFVSAVLRLDVELERIGDYAVAVAREAIQLSSPPSGSVAADVHLIAEQSQRMFRQAMDAFDRQNAELARGTLGMADQVDNTSRKVFSDLLEEGRQGSRDLKDLFATLAIFNRIGRVADQSKNICEETLFTVSGETKRDKVYRILFVDERNDGASQLAEAYARKAFPDSGNYDSAGWAPAERPSPALVECLDAKALGGAHSPKALRGAVDDLARYHVVVALDAATATRISEIPFHTVVLEWDVAPIEGSGDSVEETLARLKVAIRELMETLRGEGAS